MARSQASIQMGNRDLQLVSWNVRGLGSVVKRGKVFKHLKSLCADVIFLQETHIKSTMRHVLKCNWISQIYQSPFTSHAKGVAILFKKNVPFQICNQRSSGTMHNGFRDDGFSPVNPTKYLRSKYR